MNTEVFDLRSDTNITTAAKKTMFYTHELKMKLSGRKEPCSVIILMDVLLTTVM